VLKELLKPRVIELGKEVADVSVEHPFHLLRLDPDGERIEAMMRAAPGPEPVREADEVLLSR
jgi:pyruvate-formate lyase-activating enzyme